MLRARARAPKQQKHDSHPESGTHPVRTSRGRVERHRTRSCQLHMRTQIYAHRMCMCVRMHAMIWWRRRLYHYTSHIYFTVRRRAIACTACDITQTRTHARDTRVSMEMQIVCDPATPTPRAMCTVCMRHIRIVYACCACFGRTGRVHRRDCMCTFVGVVVAH